MTTTPVALAGISADGNPTRKEKIVLKDGDIVKGSAPELFLIAGQRRRWIADPMSLLFATPRGWAAVRELPDQDIRRLPEGRPLLSILDA